MALDIVRSLPPMTTAVPFRMESSPGLFTSNRRTLAQLKHRSRSNDHQLRQPLALQSIKPIPIHKAA
jgi:hypothetical protein